MSLASNLMLDFYELNRKALARNAFDEAFAYNVAETQVNNLHHGISPTLWIPRFAQIMRDLAEEHAESDEQREAYRFAAEYAEEALSRLQNT